MNLWLFFAGVLLACLVPCGIACLRGDALERLAALEAASLIATLILLLLCEGMRRQPFTDLALALGALSLAGSLVFARFLERWM